MNAPKAFISEFKHEQGTGIQLLINSDEFELYDEGLVPAKPDLLQSIPSPAGYSRMNKTQFSFLNIEDARHFVKTLSEMVNNFTGENK